MCICFIVWLTMEASFFLFLYPLYGYCWYKGILLIFEFGFLFPEILQHPPISSDCLKVGLDNS